MSSSDYADDKEANKHQQNSYEVNDNSSIDTIAALVNEGKRSCYLFFVKVVVWG